MSFNNGYLSVIFSSDIISKNGSKSPIPRISRIIPKNKRKIRTIILALCLLFKNDKNLLYASVFKINSFEIG